MGWLEKLRGHGFFIVTDGLIELDIFPFEIHQPSAGAKHACELVMIDMVSIGSASPLIVVKIDIVSTERVLRDVDYSNTIDRAKVDLQSVVAGKDVVCPNFIERLRATQDMIDVRGNIGEKTDITGWQ